jgi:hypothetical protein
MWIGYGTRRSRAWGLNWAASAGGVVDWYMRYFISLLIEHHNRKALIMPFFRKVARNCGGVSPRGFEVGIVHPLLIPKSTAVFDVKEESRHLAAHGQFFPKRP